MFITPYSPAEPCIAVQRNSAYFDLVKAINTVCYFSLIWLTYKFLSHQLDWQLSGGCVLVSGAWLILTRIKVDHLLQTYFDVLSRIELQLPVVLGLSLSLLALFAKALHPIVHVLALAEIACWIYLFILYRHNKARFKKQGYGPVPLNTIINPPAELLRAGDLLLTSGNVAKRLHESVGHAEVVLEDASGAKMLLSSYMDKGCTLHQLSDLTGPDYDGSYVGLHLQEPWSDEQKARAFAIAQEMVKSNRLWAEAENIRVLKRINFFPLPDWLSSKLKHFFHASGYDWFGTFMGRIAPDRWTCIGAAVELYKRMKVPINHYGTGLLGVGTTLLDPIMPVRFLADPALNLIEKDQAPN
ncbi:MAG: hypothetical protein QG574_367 [Cyanobacteriota bacterium erpe_2018_sw_21hr_WHONDRS-SW48-000092_B_bin.40]|jgi:hypothetical protein|nr:hypothetical protein [Cyanobacteriota bacterium erpe_2018_sw_21hr_WHONDRS-SW48-000092_B_bin.40]